MKFRQQMLKGKGSSPQHRNLDFYHADLWEMPRLREWPIYPFYVEEAKRSVPTWFCQRNCGFMMLIMVLDGQVNYVCNDLEFPLRTGRMLLVPLSANYAFESETCGGCYHKVVLEVKGSHLASIADSLDLNRPFALDIPDNGFVSRCKEIGALMSGRNEKDIPAITGRLLELLYEVSMLAQAPSETSRLFALALARLESRLDADMPIPELASELGVSGPTLNRLFRSRLNISPQKYRMMRKIEKARELLENTSMSIKEISACVGYCNQFHFTSEFKRIAGHSPSSYRDNFAANNPYAASKGDSKIPGQPSAGA